MTEFNRYTQMPAPLIVNPISFEDFAKVPLMKAKATGEIVGANERISTEYNVDDADLGKISTLVEGIDKVKENIVTDITNNGINSQSVGQVIALKRERDRLYKTKIQQAEENKKLLFAWRQKIDDMVMRGTISPEYGEKIKEKEYGKWIDKGGTFTKDNESDLPRMFQENFGAKYFDIDRDIREQLNEIKNQETIKGTSWAGGKSHLEQGEGYTQLVTSGGGSRTKATNEANLEAAIQRIYQEYTDPNTERGRFAEYADVDISSLKDRLQKYKQEFLTKKDILQVDNSQRQLVGDGKKTDLPTTGTPYVLGEFRPSKYQDSEMIKNITPNNLTNSWRKAEDVTNKYMTDWESKLPPNRKTTAITGFGNWYEKTSRTLSEFFNNLIKGGPEVPLQDKKAVLNNYKDLVKFLTDNGKISQTSVTLAYYDKTNPVKHIDIVLDAINQYYSEKKGIEQQPAFDVSNYIETTYGKSIPGINNKKAASDAFLGDEPMYTVSDRKAVKLTADDKKEWRKIAAEDKLKLNGNIPALSIDLLDNNGNYIPGLTSASVVQGEDGTLYYRPLPEYLKNTATYKILDEINSKVVPLKPGEVVGGFYLFDGQGKGTPVKFRHSAIDVGSFQVIIPSLDGKELMYDVNDNPELLNNIVGEDFLKRKK